MLPGFRFLFAAIVLSMSVLVFGLGAAALLRAAHEQFASNPSWHAAPDATFALQAETTRPVLAMLRVEPPPAEQKASENVPAQAATLAGPNVSAPAEQAAIAPPSEPERVAALKPEEPAPPAVAKPDMAAPESPAQNDAPVSDATKAATPASDSETRVASTTQPATEPALPPAGEAARAAIETSPEAPSQARAPAAPEADGASAKVATLDNPSVTVEAKPQAKAVHGKPDRSAIKKRLRARRLAHRRWLAARARQAQLAAQQPADPFAQPIFAQPPAVARKR